MKQTRTLLIMMLMLSCVACSHRQKFPDPPMQELVPPVEEPAETVNAPGSLWTPTGRMGDLYADARARRVGDIVVVQIVETASANKEAKTSAERSNTVDASVDNLLGLPLGASSLLGYKVNFGSDDVTEGDGTVVKGGIKAGSESEFEGSGKTSRKGDVSGVVASRVIRVLPSGNLVIQGFKQIRVNSEVQYLVLSGIVRPEDITAHNTTQSSYVADLKLDYYGNGIIGDQQKRGFLSRAADKAWPF